MVGYRWMLRHYDNIGLLRPVAVDARSGYRYYTADQLRRLNRVIALKDLGLTLAQVQLVLDDVLDAAELRGLLRLRRAQLEAQLAADTTRLTRIEARLRAIDREGRMTTQDVVLKELPSLRVAELTAMAASYETADIGRAIRPLYPELLRRLAVAEVSLSGPSLAYYEPAGDGEKIVVHAGLEVAVSPDRARDFAVVDLPAVPAAATVIHRGPMDEVAGTLQLLAQWIEENGWRAEGYARELYVEYCADDPAAGVTELQQPVTRA